MDTILKLTPSFQIFKVVDDILINRVLDNENSLFKNEMKIKSKQRRK